MCLHQTYKRIRTSDSLTLIRRLWWRSYTHQNVQPIIKSDRLTVSLLTGWRLDHIVRRHVEQQGNQPVNRSVLWQGRRSVGQSIVQLIGQTVRRDQSVGQLGTRSLPNSFTYSEEAVEPSVLIKTNGQSVGKIVGKPGFGP